MKAKTRKTVEIYFILYLATLVILISTDKESKNEAANVQNEVNFPFTIKTEKPMLVCKIGSDAFGNRTVTLDSLNELWYIGDVENVNYEFVVEDQSLKHSVQLSKESSLQNRYFSFIENKENRSVIFRWRPEIIDNENKVFNVYVTATARISRLGTDSNLNFNDKINNKKQQNKQQIIAKTQFSLVITNEDEWRMRQYNLSDNPNILATETHENQANNEKFNNYSNNFYYNLAASSDFSIKPQEYRIRGIAGQDFENEIQCYGFSPRYHLKQSPAVRLQNNPENNGGTVSNPLLRDNSIIIRGKIPAFGSSKIFVNVTRNSDLKEATISFDISPIPYGVPDIPARMYPEIQYEFKPNIPADVANSGIYLKEFNDAKKETVRASTSQGNVLKFTPDLSDIGKTFSFERYSNGNLIGQKYTVKVFDFPAPEITRITRKTADIAIIETISYGIYEGKNNYVKEIRLNGNAKVQQQRYGQSRKDRNRLEFYEQFEIIPLDSKKPFVFEAEAIDQREIASKMRKFQNE